MRPAKRAGVAVLARESNSTFYGGKCACQNAEAKAFLAKMRVILEAIDRGELT